MHIERIKEAVRFLKQVHLEGRDFDYKGWGSKTECGTIACAGGWLTLNEKLQLEGLSNINPYFDRSNLVPTFQGEVGDLALAYFFEIAHVRAENIFLSAGTLLNKEVSCITAYDIAELLEKLLPPEEQVEEHCVIETPRPGACRRVMGGVRPSYHPAHLRRPTTSIWPGF